MSDMIEAAGRVLAENLAGSEIERLSDILGEAAEGCSYAADDYAYRAEFEQRHAGADPDGSEGNEYMAAANGYSATAETIGELVAALAKANEEVEGDD